ncbi:MAG: PadR family transcriptional regulator [Bacilli bacterium]|nr:PadR family transcriptional regulator [Bacilli bacterium]
MDYYKGHYQAMILALLNRDGDSYGYEMNAKISTLTDDAVSLTEATLYTTLKDLLANEMITCYYKIGNNNMNRKYYSITEKGKTFLKAYIEEGQKAYLNLKCVILGRKEI